MNDTSIKKDVIYVLIALGIFIGMVSGVGYVDVGAAYHLLDVFALATKVFSVSLMTWMVKRFVFPNTLGKDFGKTFDDGWKSLDAKEKTRWTLGGFLVLFVAIALLV